MRWMKWVGIAAAIVLIVSCFSTWVIITTKNLTVTGVDATGTNFGRPGYFNLLFTAFFLFFTLIPRVWAKRANVVVTGFNMAWAIRNYFVISACRGGDCPEKHVALYLLVVASLFMLLSSLFPDMDAKRIN
jgi:hypothetical protein